MTIYTTGEVDAQALAMLLKERDELRAALKARDEEIALMKVKETDWTAAYQEATRATVHASQLDTKLTAQCNVLEQALEALHDATWYVEQEDRAMDEYHSQHPWRLACEQRHKKEIERNKAAITAIQEVLK
jgi:chromosome segregation ATPase